VDTVLCFFYITFRAQCDKVRSVNDYRRESRAKCRAVIINCVFASVKLVSNYVLEIEDTN